MLSKKDYNVYYTLVSCFFIKKLQPSLKEFIFAERLGSGTYAVVYKAYRKEQKREVVAIKCVLKSSLSKQAVENLLTEISILKKLKHDHIVEMKDFQWDDNFIYVIMEYCSGGDLSHFIKKKRRIPELLVKQFLQQLATGFQFLRSQNIAHMDLKPQNILLSSVSQPVLKIADFGFAQYMHQEEVAYSMRGSPLYMAPEILMKHEYGATVDLWSIGVVLFANNDPLYEFGYRQVNLSLTGCEFNKKAYSDTTALILGMDFLRKYKAVINMKGTILIPRLVPPNTSVARYWLIYQVDAIKWMESISMRMVRRDCACLKCLFGQAPYSSKTFAQLAEKIKSSTSIEIPYAVNISDECRDLILRLLKRDPSERIAFDQFFSHPFLDLKHMATPESLIIGQVEGIEVNNVKQKDLNAIACKSLYPMMTQWGVSAKAQNASDAEHTTLCPPSCLPCVIFVFRGLLFISTKLATDAVKEDVNNKVPQSINLYCESLLYLVPHVNEYIERAEELKDSLKQNFISNKQRNKVCDLEYKLQNLYSENPKVIASLKLLKHAEVLETEDKFKEALEKYELGIAGLMAVLSVETDEERKSLLRRQVAEWLKRAEQIKSYLSVNNVQSKESSQINNSSPGNVGREV
ncbi:Serine/threonine-protein kinase ULK3 [Nymphon striatum]|nr:Serine/threonine-protein kinase ULK3 [Nymphon striatum]